MVGVDEIQAKVIRQVWLMALNGIFEEQIDYAINQLVTAQTPFQKFPPNPQEFRAICMCFKMPEKPKEQRAQLEYNESPEAKAEREIRIKEQYEGCMIQVKKMNQDHRDEKINAEAKRKEMWRQVAEKENAEREKMLKKENEWRNSSEGQAEFKRREEEINKKMIEYLKSKGINAALGEINEISENIPHENRGEDNGSANTQSS
jgi:hypothetical protein